MAISLTEKIADSSLRSLIQDGYNFLHQHGWRFIKMDDSGVSLWQDTLGCQRPRQFEFKFAIEARDGSKEEVSQTAIEAAGWTLPVRMEQALLIQRLRLEGKEKA
jgi:hypothetical protein